MIPHTGPHVNCLIRCQSKHCSSSTCCSRGDEIDEVHHNQNRHIINRKFGSKETLPVITLPEDQRPNVSVDEISEVPRSCDKPKCPPTPPEVVVPRLQEKLSEPAVIVTEGSNPGHTISVDVVKSAVSLASTETEVSSS